MAIIVQKFGGSSVADAEKIRAVSEKVASRRARGDQLVVVVSAMGDTTDELLSLAKKVSDDPPRRELDMLLTAGERISMALLSMALGERGVPAISFTGSQSGIITDDAHANAQIVEVRPYRIQEELSRGKVVIVAGYQGVSTKKEVTTLGRGGSDTTAVALAAALSAEACEIYSDVDGVFSADPRVVPQAKKLAEISYEEMQELAEAGARVLNAQAVEFAKKAGIVIHAKSTFRPGNGTLVHEAPPKVRRMVGVASEEDLLLLRLHGARPRLTEMLEFLDDRGAAAKEITYDGSAMVSSMLVPLMNVHGTSPLIREISKQFAGEASLLEGIGAVSVVGAGINRDGSNLRRALNAIGRAGLDCEGVHTSSFRISMVVRRERVGDTVRCLHAEFLP
jgi:aspartate kinase